MGEIDLLDSSVTSFLNPVDIPRGYTAKEAETLINKANLNKISGLDSYPNRFLKILGILFAEIMAKLINIY